MPTVTGQTDCGLQGPTASVITHKVFKVTVIHNEVVVELGRQEHGTSVTCEVSGSKSIRDTRTRDRQELPKTRTSYFFTNSATRDGH